MVVLTPREDVMSDESSGFMPDPSAWTAVPPVPGRGYELAVRDHGLATAVGLLARSLPYALARFAILFAWSTACIAWMVVAFGGAAWLGTHVVGAFGSVWLVLCVIGVGWFWGAVLRYALHFLACGRVAVLTELIMRGTVGNGSEAMLADGKRLVLQRFGEVNALFGLNKVVRGILNELHRTLEGIEQALGLESLSSLVMAVLRAATRYLDKVIFSYNLAHADADPWVAAHEGLVYYAQNARPILMTAVWIVLLERVLTVVLWLALLIPAGLLTVHLPLAVREASGVATILIALLLAATLRAAFIKPLFLIVTTVRFHAPIEHQPINEAWNAQLDQVSDRFRSLGKHAAEANA
jgi:hypothetical protein